MCNGAEPSWTNQRGPPIGGAVPLRKKMESGGWSGTGPAMGLPSRARTGTWFDSVQVRRQPPGNKLTLLRRESPPRLRAPDGSLTGTIEVPGERVTNCAFGGPDLRTLFITTARTGLATEQLVAQPLAGGLFAVSIDGPGMPAHLFGG